MSAYNNIILQYCIRVFSNLSFFFLSQHNMASSSYSDNFFPFLFFLYIIFSNVRRCIQFCKSSTTNTKFSCRIDTDISFLVFFAVIVFHTNASPSHSYATHNTNITITVTLLCMSMQYTYSYTTYSWQYIAARQLPTYLPNLPTRIRNSKETEKVLNYTLFLFIFVANLFRQKLLPVNFHLSILQATARYTNSALFLLVYESVVWIESARRRSAETLVKVNCY